MVFKGINVSCDEMYLIIKDAWVYISPETKWDIFKDAINSGDVDDYYDIFEMADFDDMLSKTSPSDIAYMVTHGDFDTNDGFFTYDGLGNLLSLDEDEAFDCIDDCLPEIIEHIMKTEAWNIYSELKDVLNDYEYTEVEEGEDD